MKLLMIFKNSKFKLVLISCSCFFVLISFISCNSKIEDRNYRQLMRYFVRDLSRWAKKVKPDFIIIPQNGHELLTENGFGDGHPNLNYINAIDGVGRESLNFGHSDDGFSRVPSASHEYLLSQVNVAKIFNRPVLVTDYTDNKEDALEATLFNKAQGFLSFVSATKNLTLIPKLSNFNKNSVNKLTEAKNFLYIINPENYKTKASYLMAIKSTEYDVVIMDALYNEAFLTTEDISFLKKTPSGRSRLLIAYLSIGEAENYRFYWKSHWNIIKPSWIEHENEHWAGNFNVRYWHKKWQKIIYGNKQSYLATIIDQGFDGVYLDIIDGFYYFESRVESQKSYYTE